MGFVLDFDAKNNIVRVTVEGRLTDAIMSDGYGAAARLCAVPSTASRHYRPLEGGGVRRFQRRVKATGRDFASISPAEMRIVITRRDHVYGMTRMFQTLAEKTRPNLQIVRAMDEAYRLLQMESPELVPVS